MSFTIQVIIFNVVQISKQRLRHPLAIMISAGPGRRQSLHLRPHDDLGEKLMCSSITLNTKISLVTARHYILGASSNNCPLNNLIKYQSKSIVFRRLSFNQFITYQMLYETTQTRVFNILLSQRTSNTYLPALVLVVRSNIRFTVAKTTT